MRVGNEDCHRSAGAACEHPFGLLTQISISWSPCVGLRRPTSGDLARIDRRPVGPSRRQPPPRVGRSSLSLIRSSACRPPTARGPRARWLRPLAVRLSFATLDPSPPRWRAPESGSCSARTPLATKPPSDCAAPYGRRTIQAGPTSCEPAESRRSRLLQPERSTKHALQRWRQARMMRRSMAAATAPARVSTASLV